MSTRLDASRLALAATLTFAIGFLICFLFVMIAPDSAAQIATSITHIDFSQIRRTTEWGGFLTGLICGGLIVYIGVWVTAAFYNALPRGREGQ